MNKINLCFSALVILIGYLIYFNKSKSFDLNGTKTCASCFGSNLCKDFEENKIVLEYKLFSDFFNNIFSVKSVYFAKYNNASVVVKHLGVQFRENLQNDDNFYVDNFSGSKDFMLCSERTFLVLCEQFSATNESHLLKMALNFNMEPVLLRLFSSENYWPIPYYYGCCGEFIVVKNHGKTLNSLEDTNWFDRAYVALQLLEAARNFTTNHNKFILYLTDVSPDNIVVDEHLKVTFVDLENGLLAENKHGGTVHQTTYFSDENFLFSPNDICNESYSDHNIYSVCKLLLSKDAPWPMMRNGLLHSPPPYILENYWKLFRDIELCVKGMNRLQTSTKIRNMLLEILNSSVHKHKL